MEGDCICEYDAARLDQTRPNQTKRSNKMTLYVVTRLRDDVRGRCGMLCGLTSSMHVCPSQNSCRPRTRLVEVRIRNQDQTLDRHQHLQSKAQLRRGKGRRMQVHQRQHFQHTSGQNYNNCSQLKELTFTSISVTLCFSVTDLQEGRCRGVPALCSCARPCPCRVCVCVLCCDLGILCVL